MNNLVLKTDKIALKFDLFELMIFYLKKLELSNSRPMTIPSISMRKFFILKISPNFFSQESGMLFRLSSLDIPDLIDCFANQKKNNKITAVLHAIISNMSAIDGIFMLN